MSEVKIKVERRRSTPYTVNYKVNGNPVAYVWAGAKGDKKDSKDLDKAIVDYLLMSSRCFDEGELVIIENNEEATEMVNNISNKEQYENNTRTREDMEKLLSIGNFKQFEKELKKITVATEKHFLIQVAKEIKLDSSAKRKAIADLVGTQPDILFSDVDEE